MERYTLMQLRYCKDCNTAATDEGELSFFVKDEGSKYGRRNLCISCAVVRNERHPKTKDWKTDHQTKKRYGIDAETYKQRMASQSSCEICASNKELCYDHDHATMEFRGVLCRQCNRALGQLGDSLGSIMNVVKYLTKGKHDNKPIRA